MRNHTAWQRIKAEFRFYKWPLVIQLALQIAALFLLVDGRWHFSYYWLLTLSNLISLPFIFVDGRRRRKEFEAQKREMQAKYDAEDIAMFGKPLRDIEL